MRKMGTDKTTKQDEYRQNPKPLLRFCEAAEGSANKTKKERDHA
jgi:hypothetical protein